MATNITKAKRDNRVWLSCPRCLLLSCRKLLPHYEKEDIYTERIRLLRKKHGCHPEDSGENRSWLKMDMYLCGTLEGAGSVMAE